MTMADHHITMVRHGEQHHPRLPCPDRPDRLWRSLAAAGLQGSQCGEQLRVEGTGTLRPSGGAVAGELIGW